MNNAPILVSGQYLLVSGGDDAALYAAEFNLKLNKNDVTKVHVTREVSEPFAHTSSVTGNDGSTSFSGSSPTSRKEKRDLGNEVDSRSLEFIFRSFPSGEVLDERRRVD